MFYHIDSTGVSALEPNRHDPDFQYHDERWEVIKILRDDTGASTGDERDSYLYRVRLALDTLVDLSWLDLRPVL